MVENIKMGDIAKFVCKEIKRRRKEAGLSQADLAAKCGWLNDEGLGSQSRIGNYESGRAPKVDDLELIASALNSSVVELISRPNFTNNSTLPAKQRAELIFEKLMNLPEDKSEALLRISGFLVD